MNTKLLSISLALVTSVLVACGGGGDARSPDRPAPRLDPSTLRIDFPLGNKLAGLGTNKAEDGIPARMVGLQTDGVETNLGPELNVTEGTSWTISGPLGDPAIAGLAAAVRSATSFGKVKDILSTAFLAEPKGTITLTLKGTYPFQGRNYVVSANFLVVPPKRVLSPFIDGPEIIAIDPLDATKTETANYQLLQALQGLTMRENRTGEAKFCANKSFFTFAAYSESQSAAIATITNPFNNTNSQEGIPVIISAIPPSADCATLYDADPDNNPTLFAVKTVTVQPARVKSVDVCVITNPPALTCKANGGELDQSVAPLTTCQGLDTATTAITSATVPAASNIQMVAKLHYENPTNINQSFDRYQCRGANVLSWSAEPKTIYSTPLNTTAGTATLISQAAYDGLRNDPAKNNSTVTAKYNNSTTQTIEGDLKLNLTDAAVTKITIAPKVGPIAADKKYKINLSVLESEKAFKAICTYASGDAPCGSGTVSWTVGKADTLKVDPVVGTETSASPATPATPVFGESSLIATYKGMANRTDSVTVEIVDDALEDLLLMQADENGAAVEDEFSCLGSGNVDLNGSQDGLDADLQKGSRQFFAHAKFKSSPNYIDITNIDSVVFTADVGYYDSANTTCITTPQSGDVPIPVDQISASKPAAFSSDPAKKGMLEAQGEVRFSTMCVRVFIDLNNNEVYDAPAADTPKIESEVLSSNGATTLVQPAGNLALNSQGGSACAVFEPLLSGDNPLAEPVLLPLLFELGYYADPVVSNLPVDSLPIDQITDALSSGDLSTITDLLNGGGGGGDLPLPPEALAGLQAIQDLAGGLSQESIMEIAEACLVTEDDVTGFISGLTDAIQNQDPAAGQAAFEGLIDGAISPEDCAAAFQ